MESSMETQMPEDPAAEIERIRTMVDRFFPVYETKMHPDSISFHCRINAEMLEENFDRLRGELKKLGYLPIITYRGGEHIVSVGKLPEIKPKGIWLNFVMLGLTISTTIIAGLILWKAYIGETTGPFFNLESIAMGALTFALPLMTILGIHEMGHYLIARHHGVPASLPFFIPLPPITIIPLGTLGAFISIRGPIPDRKTLFDLGVSGPIAGFIATIPVAIIGIFLTGVDARPLPAEIGGLVNIFTPLMYDVIGLFFPISGDYLLHPTAFAAWVGFFITAINLLPAGSLDGGHIARAIFGENAKYLSWIAVICLFILGIFFTGWWIFAVIILFLGMSHSPPLNDITILSSKRKLVGLAMGLMLVISFVPIPLEIIEEDPSFDAELQGSYYGNISASLDHTFVILINSTGNKCSNLTFDLSPVEREELSFRLEYQNEGENDTSAAPEKRIEFPIGANLTIFFTVYLNSPISEDVTLNASINIVAETENNFEFERHIPINLTEHSGGIDIWLETSIITMLPDEISEVSVFINSSYFSNITLELTVLGIPFDNWSAGLYYVASTNMTNELEVSIGPGDNITCGLVVRSPTLAEPGETIILKIEAVLEDQPIDLVRELTITIE